MLDVVVVDGQMIALHQFLNDRHTSSMLSPQNQNGNLSRVYNVPPNHTNLASMEFACLLKFNHLNILFILEQFSTGQLTNELIKKRDFS